MHQITQGILLRNISEWLYFSNLKCREKMQTWDMYIPVYNSIPPQ